MLRRWHRGRQCLLCGLAALGAASLLWPRGPSAWAPAALAGPPAVEELGQVVRKLRSGVFETGPFWPLLSFALACAALWQRKSSPAEKEAPPPEAPLAPVEVQVPPGYALVPVSAAPQHEMVPAHDCRMLPTVTPQDFKALWERSRHDEALSEGVATMRRAFNEQSSSGALGGMTAAKIMEIERMLVQELEDSVVGKVGFIASLFHRWRCEAHVSRVGRQFEEDFDRKRGDWDSYLREQDRSLEERLLDAARTVSRQQAQRREAAAFLLSQWASTEATSLVHIILRAWHDVFEKQKALLTQKKRVHTVLSLWVEGDRHGSLHVCYQSWCQLLQYTKLAARTAAELSDAKQHWDQFFDSESKRLKGELDAALGALKAERSRANADVALVLNSWERGERLGLLDMVLQSWCHCVRRVVSIRRQRHGVHQAVMQFVSGEEAGAVRGCFRHWRTATLQQAVLSGERRKWEELVSSERARHLQEDAERNAVALDKSAAAHSIVQLVLRKWEVGDTSGLLAEVLRSWHGVAAKSGTAERRLKHVHAALLRWIGGGQAGDTYVAYLHWKQQAVGAGLARRQERELERRTKAWEELLADDRGRREQELGDRRSAAARRQDRARAVVGLALTRWECGEEAGLVLQLFRSWSLWTREALRLARKRQAVHAALRLVLNGDNCAELHTCILNWRIWTAHVKDTTFGEARLAAERAKWEAFLEKERRDQEAEMAAFQTEAEARRARVHEATDLMLRQWHRGQSEGLLATVFLDWRRLAVAEGERAWRRQSVRLCVMRFIEGDLRADAHTCLLNWQHWAKVERLYKEEVHERQRRVVQLEERAGELVSRSQRRLLKYACALGSSDEPVLLILVLSAWRTHAMGIRAMEATRQIEVALEERQRQHQLAVTRKRRMSVSTLQFLGVREVGMVMLDCLLAWSYQRQHSKHEWAHNLTHSKLIEKYCSLLLPELLVKQDTTAILAACLWALLQNARHQRHLKHSEQVELQIIDKDALLQQIQHERNQFDDQVQLAYRQLDLITEMLQKECKTKEDLTTELREVNEKLRQQSSSMRSTQVPMRSVSTSRRQATEVPPHLPGSILGARMGASGTVSLTSAREEDEEVSVSSPGSRRTPVGLSRAGQRLLAGRAKDASTDSL